MMKLPKTMNNAPKRARTPKMMRTAILAALAVAATACSNDLPDASGNTPDTPNGKTTIHVSAGQKAGTRVAYEDAAAGEAGKLTWQTGDRLTVVRMNEGNVVTGKANDYLYQGIDGATSGDFKGTTIDAAGNSWTVYYPHTVTVNNSDGSATLPMTGQTQTEDKSTEHLKNYMLLACTGIEDINSSFTLAMKSSIMKFDLKNVPAGVGKLKTLTWMVETAAATRSLTLNFAPDAVDFSNSGDAGTLTAFLSFMPQDMAVKADGKFTVVLTGDKTYQASTTISGGKNYEAGKRYTAEFGDWEEKEKAMMALTVKVKNNDESRYFQIPFGTSGTSPAELTINWGDGKSTTVESGASINANTFTHAYATIGEYLITITSGQTDATKQQIPRFNFKRGVDDSSVTQNARKLISIDTPLLNTGATNFSECFSYCSNLTSIPEGLFDNNTEAKYFASCFSYCEALESIPEGLFNKNEEVTDFRQCFYGCEALTSIPEGLFNNNAKATDFRQCFQGCKALTSIPQGLFDKHTKVTDFNSCFDACEALTSIPEGLFNNNKEVTTFSYCFNGCKALTSIPPGLFNNNTAATNFSSCFKGCVQLVLNEKIFSTEPNMDRFADKAMNFANCFQGVGTELGSNQNNTAPNLWGYNKGDATWTTTDCFKGAVNLTNWTNIPEAWGGPPATKSLPLVPSRGSAL